MTDRICLIKSMLKSYVIYLLPSNSNSYGHNCFAKSNSVVVQDKDRGGLGIGLLISKNKTIFQQRAMKEDDIQQI